MRECGVAVYGVSRPQRVAPGPPRGARARAPPRPGVGEAIALRSVHSYRLFLHNFNYKSSLAWRKRNKFHNTYHDFSET